MDSINSNSKCEFEESDASESTALNTDGDSSEKSCVEADIQSEDSNDSYESSFIDDRSDSELSICSDCGLPGCSPLKKRQRGTFVGEASLLAFRTMKAMRPTAKNVIRRILQTDSETETVR